MEDRNLYPVALHWDLGPEKLKQMKNKLSIYFGSPKKSNGGECVMEDMDCTKGHVLIHFNKRTVRDQVLMKQEHVLTLPDEQELKLDVRPLESKNKPSKTSPKEQESPAESTAKKRLHYPGTKDESDDTCEPQHKRSHLQDTSHAQPGSKVTSAGAGAGTPEPRSSLVLIENVQDPCTLEMLNPLLENITLKEKTQDFQVQMVPEICAAVVTFTSKIDLLGFLRDFGSSLRANTLKLTAKRLEETSAIRVEGLPPNTSEDHIILYFESSNHGGGKVQETELLPEQNAATIKFHEMGGTSTFDTPYGRLLDACNMSRG
uniref:PAR14 n=1 Tax=Leptobrachium leishanense TaxID=445787 RepID=A0A8C5R3J1_9ANUR